VRRYAPWLLLAVGVALRLALFLSRSSLSIDETSLALDIGTHSYAQLLHPLPSLQTAPPLFLETTKLATVVFGMSEWSLRLVPLVCGLALLVVTWRVARRLLPGPAAIATVGLGAVTPTLVQYSVTAKPYIGDALTALVMMALALAVLEDPAGQRRWWRLGLGGVVAVLWSIPAPFVLVAVAAALASGLWARHRTTEWRRIAACGAAWGIGSTLVYVLFYRGPAASPYMAQFWSAAFFTPLHPAGWRLLGTALVQALVARPVPAPAMLAALLLFAIGCGYWWRTGSRWVVLVFGATLLTVLAASTAHRYPLSARLLLGIVPMLLLATGGALAVVMAWRAGVGLATAVALTVLLLGVDLTHPYRTPATREAIAALQRQRASAEPVYVASGAIPAWAFYTTDWRAVDTAYLGRIARDAGVPGAPAFHNSASSGRPVDVVEGSALAVSRGDHLELLGVASGIQWREVMGLGQVVADSGWATHEATRIKAAAAPTIWLVIANAYAASGADLESALERAGGVRLVDTVAGGVRWSRFGFRSIHAPTADNSRPMLFVLPP
jgi:4-amino-4-deoxy-L-arabinose transferase-like glycosyltransferase